MADVRDQLRRELDGLVPSPGGYEKTIARARTRQRNRRFAAVALGLGLTALLATGFWVTARQALERPATTPSPKPTDLASPVPIVPSSNGPLVYTDADGQSIVIARSDGTPIDTIDFPGIGMPWHIAWSPDGRSLAVVVFGETRSLWVLNDGSAPIELASGSNVHEPSWSPDGSWIAYSIDRATTSEIHVVRPNGMDDTIVRSVPRSGTFAIFSAKFSPDGTQILFDEGTDSNFDIFVMTADGTAVRQLTHSGVDYDPAWSPDGRQIVFTRQAGATSDIFIMNADGSQIRRLTNAGQNDANLNPAFAPDGKSITYMATNPRSMPIVRIELDGSDPVVVVDQEVLGFSWAADGTPVDSTFTPPTLHRSPPQKVAEGENAGRRWTLSLTDGGLGLDFQYENGGGGGAGSELGNQVFGLSLSGGRSWDIRKGWSTAPRDVEGVVTSRAARVEFQLIDGGVIQASLYDLPADAFGGGAQAYVLFVPYTFLIHAGDLVAYDDEGNELGRLYQDFSPVSLSPAVIEASSAEAVDAMKSLQRAGAVAARYFYAHDSWRAFDANSASEIDDSITYNTSSSALVGEVSIRVVGNDGLVLATRISNGDVYSACMAGGPQPAIAGRNDTGDPASCSNGWLNTP